MSDTTAPPELIAWLRTQLPDSNTVTVEGFDRVNFGFSSDTLLFTVVREEHGDVTADDVVLRLRPPAPGLLEPYDLGRQFTILQALESAPVRSPRAYWHEGSGTVLGREFYVMERLPGSVYELSIPDDIRTQPDLVRGMTESLIEQLVAIHSVDLGASGLETLDEGPGYLERELARWAGEMRRVQHGPLPALERVLAELQAKMPAQPTRVTLVHGDAKSGNFAFVGDEVSAVFDWELSGVGDPLTDIGYADALWEIGAGITSVAGALTADEFIARYEELTGYPVTNREWYRAMQTFKLAVIILVGAMHYDSGLTDDPRLGDMVLAVPFFTGRALADLGVDEILENGPIEVRRERAS